MKKNLLLLSFILLFSVLATAQTEKATTQIAITEDGKRVILKSDGTWQYEKTGENSAAASKELIIGKWIRTKLEQPKTELFYPTEVEFFDDVTFSMLMDLGISGTKAVAGDYKFVTDKRIRLDAQGFFSTIADISVSRTGLVMKFNSGGVATFKRAE